MADDPYRPDLKGAPRRDHRQANPPAYGRAAGDVEATRQLRAIDERSAKVKGRLREHLSRHQDRWIAREAIKVWEHRARQASKYPIPKGAVPEGLSPQALIGEATRRVRARAMQRLTRLNEATARMRNAVINSRPELRQDPGLARKPRRTLKLNWEQLP